MSRGIIDNSQTIEVHCSSYICGVTKYIRETHNKKEVLSPWKNKWKKEETKKNNK